MNNSNCSYLLNPGTEIDDHSLHDIAKSKGLKIASLNVNSLLKHIDEIRVLLEKYTFDILAINESKIDNSIPDNEIQMRRRDFHKKQAVKHNSKLQWESHKAERNKVNIQMRQAKSKYFCDKIQNCSHSKDVKKVGL